MDSYARKITEAGFMPSPQRMAIYRFVCEHPIHPTADTVYESVHRKIPTLSRTTVYNVLHAFSQAGLIRKVAMDEGGLRFDADLSRHAHFKCVGCGKVMDIFLPDPIEAKGVELPNGTVVVDTQLLLRGICPECATTQPKLEEAYAPLSSEMQTVVL